MRRTSLTLSIVVGLVLTAVSPAAAGRRVYEIDQADLAETIEDLQEDGVETLSGEIEGAAWIAQVPDDWNGELLVWAHGYRGEGTSLTVDPPPNRQSLLDGGTAWVASSYRRNSYDPGIGVIDTMLVTKHLQSLLGGVERTYLAGVSMGGHVTAAAIETYRGLYDGALPTCGVLGDVELFDYFVDYNLGAAAFAGLDADTLEYPDAEWLEDEVPEIRRGLSFAPEDFATTPDPDGPVANIWASSGAFATLAGFGVPVPAVPDVLTTAGDSFKRFVEQGSGGERGFIYDVGWDYWHLGASPTGDFFFALGEGDGTIADRAGVVGQNSDTDYASEYGTGYIVDVDDEVLRVTAANRVRTARGTKPAPIIDGTPDIPVLTMHTIGDLFVPIEMEQIYAAEVAANGRSDLLVQRAIRDVGHCTFTGDEWADAYGDLFAWVRDGVRPAGDDITDLSSPLAGCAFTRTDPAPSGSLRAFPCP